MKNIIYFLFFLYGCSDIGEPKIEGCTDPNACNYNENATSNIDCHQNDECGICNGNGSTCNISYSNFVQDIFNTHCINCHGTSGGLNLSNYTNLMSGNTVVPFDYFSSELWIRINSGQMPPPGNNELTQNQIDLIAQWINEGAKNN